MTTTNDASVNVLGRGMTKSVFILDDSPYQPVPEAKPEVVQGLVLHCDGGARGSNPGFGGWGCHGYLYEDTPPKKGNGNSDFYITASGYISKTEAAVSGQIIKEVTAINYIDGYGSFAELVSNNVAELMAAIQGLIYAERFAMKSVLIVTDSEYVRTGFSEWIVMWKKNNWLKRDGTPPANIDIWKQLIEVSDRLINRGVTVNINWIRAHSGQQGNELADRLATVGVMTSKAKRGQSFTEINTVPAEGYWKYNAEKHPFIYNRRMYFNTMTDYIVPGVYYMGEHGKDDDLLGKRTSDGAYAVIHLKEPDVMLELLRNYQASLANETDTLIMARLDKLYRADTHRELTVHGTLAMTQPNPKRYDLFCLDGEPLTRELQPPRLAMRMVDAVSDLSDKLRKYLAKDESIITTDLTSTIYSSTTVVSKKGVSTTTVKLKPEFNVGFAALPVDANYESRNANGDPSIASAKVTLVLGIDLVDRNSLKRMETMNPTVTLISWLEAPEVFRYATVIEAGEDKAIYAGVYSNVRIVTTA